jgi:nucleoside-diphosphate-sugar epimerase
VEANILAAGEAPGLPIGRGAYVATSEKHEVFNVANGKDNTVLELVNLLNKIIGKNVQPKFLPVRVGDVFRTSADISKISTKLGFKPVVSFEEGLRKTVEYFRGVYKKDNLSL